MEKNLNVTMLGPSQVGKTSLLAVMHSLFRSTINTTDLRMTPHAEDSAVLSSRLEELKSIFESDTIRPGLGMKGDQESKTYKFEIGRIGRPTAFGLHLRDYPGRNTLEQAVPVQNSIRECVATLIAVETPALMEAKNARNPLAWHNERNHPDHIYNLFEGAYSSLAENEKRLVIIAPVKCERYMQTAEDRSILCSKVREGYQDLLTFLTKESLRHRVSVVITPVQTTGTILFSHMIDPGKYSPAYCKDTNAVFSPKDVEQPLRYLLRFLMKMYVANQESQRGWFMQWWASLFNFDGDFKRAVEQFAEGCKDNDGFVVLQGRNLL